MTLGSLSEDQARYVQTVASQTGLDVNVVRAWVGEESGWGIYKPGHNYLNIGPGRQYTSVDQAAANAAQLVNTSSYYPGIRAAIPQGPAAQVDAIGASPWGTNASQLKQVWSQVTGTPATADPSTTPTATQAGFSLNPLSHLPSLSNLAGGAASALGIDKLVSTALSGLLSLMFVGGALALIGLGISRLTGVTARDAFNHAQTAAGTVGTAAQLAAL